MKFDRKTRAHRWVMIQVGERPVLVWSHDFLQSVLCFFSGHTPERDDCGNPEHDFCLWCRKSIPNSWPKAPR